MHIINIFKYNIVDRVVNYKCFIDVIFGDWGLGIGDWAQSPIPNPQSPK